MNQKANKKKGLLGRLALLALTIYLIFTVVDMQVALADRKGELLVLEGEHQLQKIKNKDLTRQITNGMDEEEIERVAREQLDFVLPNEKVFIDISGS